MNAILTYVYRKKFLQSRYSERVILGLISLNLVKKVDSKKGIFYFKTEKSKDFKAIDFAKEFLWAFHNPDNRKDINGKQYIFCYDQEIESGRGLVLIDEAIKKGYI